MLIKRHKRLFMAAIIIFVLVSAGAVGFISAQNEPPIVDDEASSMAVGVDNTRLVEGADITWQYEYKMCGHHIIIHCPADENMVGMTFTDFQETFPDARIVSFDSDAVVLKKTFDCYCPDHYILKKHEDELAIFRTSLGTDESYIYMTIPIVFDSIRADQQAILSVGKLFDNLADLESYIEDIET